MPSPCISTTRAGHRCQNSALRGIEHCALHAQRGIPNGHTCPTCRIRYQLPIPRELYAPSLMSKKDWVWLVNAAAIFDQESGDQLFRASEFIAWVRPDLARHRVPVPGPEADGVREKAA